MEKVICFFQYQFKYYVQGSKVVEYFKQCGLFGEIVKQWEIGYVLFDWDVVFKIFGIDNVLRKQLFDFKLVN